MMRRVVMGGDNVVYIKFLDFFPDMSLWIKERNESVSKEEFYYEGKVVIRGVIFELGVSFKGVWGFG